MGTWNWKALIPIKPRRERPIMRRNPSLLTTGQAARLCEVTPDTILKWITKGRLRGARTAGGHYRINPRDLEPHMTPGRLEEASADTPRCSPEGLHCWECLGDKGVVQDKCKKCVYYRRVQGLPTNVLVITPDEALLERLSTEENDSVTLRFARSAYEASAIAQDFQAAYVVVDEELLAAGEVGLLDHLSTDPRLPGVRIVLGVQHGTAGAQGDERNKDEDVVYGVIEKPFGLRRIAAVINSFPIERSMPPDPTVKV